MLLRMSRPAGYIYMHVMEYIHIIIRNEQNQEELWCISCELLKEWMSPEIWNKYGPSKQIDNDNDGQHTDMYQPLIEKP